ncbi:MAG: cytochrome c [Chlorobi bacterium]|nr:cytochrome c [Chlorobiota bacterium]MCI0716415.1 cytochrome c [Chlorobiota bacterium]
MNTKNKSLLKIAIAVFSLMLFVISINGCGEKDEFGVGPVKDEMKLAPIDNNLVAKGKQIFDVKCVSCHKFDTRLVGPPLKDVTKRRRPEWIMNQILNPTEMTMKDPIAKQLFAQYLVQMTFQDVTHDDARAILEYFRAVDNNQITAQ